MIYIATHKKFRDPHLSEYIPIQVGAENREDLGYLRDNTGNNTGTNTGDNTGGTTGGNTGGGDAGGNTQ